MSIKVNVFMDTLEHSVEWIENFIDHSLYRGEEISRNSRYIDYGYVQFFPRILSNGAKGVRGHAAIVPEWAWFTERDQQFVVQCVQPTLVPRNEWFRDNQFTVEDYIFQINRRDSMRGIFKHNGNVEGLNMMINVERKQYKNKMN